MSKVEKIAPARETAATERGKSEDSQEFSRTYQVILHNLVQSFRVGGEPQDKRQGIQHDWHSQVPAGYA